MEIIRLKHFVETLCRERKEVVMLTQDIRYLVVHSLKIQAHAKTLRKQNIELDGEVWEKAVNAIVESVLLKAVTEELASAKSKLVASSSGETNSRLSAHCVAKDASTVEEDVRNGLVAVTGDETDAARQKVSVTELELKDAVKRVSSQVEVEF